MRKIEHLGIAVRDLQAAEETYTKLFGAAPYKREKVESEGVTTSFLRVGTNKIELLATDDPDSAIGRFLEKRGEGIHHIAFDVADIRAEMKRLSEEGFQLLTPEPFHGADNKLVCFIHPKSANGVLIELCQERKDAV